ncbi:ribonuclease P protein component [Ferruginibacter sp.]
MAVQQRYTLQKGDKLKSKKLIEQLFKEGKSFSLFPFRVLYLEAPASNPFPEAGASGYLQTAFSVSKKYFKKAVDRNRVKRLMREAWRLQKNELSEKLQSTNKGLNVFIIYTGNELPQYELVFEKTNAVIRRLIKIQHEITIANT